MIWLFYAANLLALFVWALLILVPTAHLTQRVASALWPFILLTAYYLIYLIYTLTAQPASVLSLETFFVLPSGLYAGWTHYLVVDLFVGQHIYRSTRHYNSVYRLNQVLTLLAVPLGVMLYLYRQRTET